MHEVQVDVEQRRLTGRVALPSAYAGARAARIPFVLWATIWRHPRTPAHALSYVPLSGYAGQISLCQLSMAGIGALVWAHLGAGGQWWALLAAIGVSALAGALVAVPALRLSGIYLALGTAAFATVCDQWFFTLPTFDVAGVRISLFNTGSVSAVGPRLFGWELGSGSELMVLAAVFLALASVGVAALRRGRFGRRLIALRDSEAAYATLGGSLLLSVESLNITQTHPGIGQVESITAVVGMR